MNLKKIQDADVEGKKVLMRVDFNVSVEEGTVKDKYKIKAFEETLRYLLGLNAKVALLSWFGRPGGKKDPQFSLNPIKDDVEYILGCKIKFVPDCIGEEVKKAVNELEEGEAVLLENVRFYSGEGDVETGKKYDEDFAKSLADGFDIFVNDAISVSHRDQASVTGVRNFLPSFAGLRLQEEIEELEKVKNNFESPSVAIIGGAKIETKLPVIKFFEEKYDYVLVGGKVANEAQDKKMEFSERVILPSDYIDDRLDIGPETLEKFKEVVAGAKTIVWNGPLGKLEEEKYSKGSNEILKAILLAKDMNKAYVLIGGGETLEILEKNKALEKIDFVSTGGGAMLCYLSGEKMPGIEVLQA